MRCRVVILILCMVAGAAGACFGGKKEATPATAAAEPFKAGEIVVLFQDGTTAAEIDEAVTATGGVIAERSAVNAARVIISVPAGEEDAYVEKYAKLKKVRAADKNVEVKAFTGGGK